MAQALASAAVFPDSLAEAIQNALLGEPKRVTLIPTPMGPVWIKRVERLSLRWRLQKGNGQRLFEKDRAALHLLGDAGLPVAPILAEGDGFFVTPDLGPNLQVVVQDSRWRGSERRAALRGAGDALGRMHRSGYCHGRPALRDLCWNGQSLHFIDMEKFSPRRNRTRHFATDLLIFLHSLFCKGGSEADADAAVTAYRGAIGEDAWAQVQRLVARIGWFGAVTRAVQPLRRRSRDLAAVARTLDFLAALR